MTVDIKFDIERCISSAKILMALVNSLLDYDQIKHNKLKLNMQFHLLSNILEEVCVPLRAIASEKDLDIVIDIDPDINAYLYTDKNRLHQIILNLVGNAIKFTKQGSITIKVRPDNDFIELLEFQIQDTGVGMDEQDMSSLFTKYVKIENENSFMNKQGAGLGLMISKSLVNALSVQDDLRGIRVKSEKGQGSVFIFSITHKKPRLELRLPVDKNGSDPETACNLSEDAEGRPDEHVSPLVDNHTPTRV